MKLKSYIFSILAVALLSCSTDDVDDVIKKEEPLVCNATLSLAVKSDVKTKALTSADYNRIKKLSLAIFVKDQLLSLTEVPALGEEKVTSITDVPVVAGAVKLILFANYFDEENLTKIKVAGTNISEYKKLEVLLKNEKNVNDQDNSGNGLTMSSEILEYDLKPGRNYVGFDEGEDGYVVTKNPVKLIRNVSKVQLETIFLRPSENYLGKGNVTFKLKEFFVANVKSRSKLISDSGSAEAFDSNSDFWLSGAYANIEGALKNGQATETPYLFYDVINPPRNFNEMNEHFPFLNKDPWVCVGNIFGLDESNKNVIEIKAEYQNGVDYKEYPKIGTSYGPLMPLGTYFYVYENMLKQDDNRTLLIVKGDYTYEPVEKGQKVVLKDRYYAVTINKEGESVDLSGRAPEYLYVKRNNVYNVILTIMGPGSDTPYDIQNTAHMSALVKVKDWDVVNQDEEVD